MKRVVVIAVATTVCVGCMSSAKVKTNPVSGERLIFAQNSVFCIPIAQDPTYESHVYEGAGQLIADKIGLYLQRQGKQFRTVQLRDRSIAQACGEKAADPVILTEILTYEDRATGWSGKPDRIELRLSLFAREQQDRRRSVVFEAQSNLVTSGLGEWGNANPTTLLSTDFNETLKRLLAP